MNRKIENCHYVTRSITKPWEHQERKLRHYCFSSGEISIEPSRNLLGQNRLLTDEQEKNFSSLIERYIGIFKANHLTQDSITNYNISRALYLYFMFQTERFRIYAKIDKSGGFDLDKLLDMPEEQLNTITETLRKKFDIVLMNASDGHILFFPEIGFFTFPILWSEEQFAVYAFALPLFSNMALCLVPKGPSQDDMINAKNVMMKFSIGINDSADKILIPNELEQSDDESLIGTITSFRTEAISHARQCDQLNQKVRDMYSSMGLNYDGIRSGVSLGT